MNTPKNFIGIDALQLVANQVFKSVVMGPQYAAPEDMQRLALTVPENRSNGGPLRQCCPWVECRHDTSPSLRDV